MDIDRDVLIARMKQYFDPDTSNEEMRRLCPRAMESTQAFNAAAARAALTKRGFKPEYVVRYCYRPVRLAMDLLGARTGIARQKVAGLLRSRIAR